MGTNTRDQRVGGQPGARARQLLTVVSLLVLLAIAILALAGARRTVLQEPKGCSVPDAQLVSRAQRC